MERAQVLGARVEHPYRTKEVPVKGALDSLRSLRVTSDIRIIRCSFRVLTVLLNVTQYIVKPENVLPPDSALLSGRLPGFRMGAGFAPI